MLTLTSWHQPKRFISTFTAAQVPLYLAGGFALYAVGHLVWAIRHPRRSVDRATWLNIAKPAVLAGVMVMIALGQPGAQVTGWMLFWATALLVFQWLLTIFCSDRAYVALALQESTSTTEPSREG